MDPIQSDAVIIGAGPAGLACAAALTRRGLDLTMLEKGTSVAPVWRRHYDRLHLHTDRNHSAGMAGYCGELLHSSAYRNPAPFARKRVLVVGFGNSGGEIALDLAEARVNVTLSVRGPVKVLPRDLFGLPLLTWAVGQAWLPPRMADFINAPMIRLAVGSLRGTGLIEVRKGPRRMIAEDRRVPLLDVGTLARIRDGSIAVRRGIEHFSDNVVVFADHSAEPFDAVILATGFRPDLRPLLPEVPELFDQHGLPRVTGGETTQPGLFFCGQTVVPTGQLREIGIEAERIARFAAVARRFSGTPSGI